MPIRHPAAAAAAALLLLAAAPARADIEIANQATVTVFVELYSPGVDPGPGAACATAGVAAGTTATVAKGNSCKDLANVRVSGPRRPNNTHAQCVLGGIAWTAGRLTVSGDLYQIVCAQ